MASAPSEYFCSLDEADCLPTLRQVAQGFVTSLIESQWIYWGLAFTSFFLLFVLAIAPAFTEKLSKDESNATFQRKIKVLIASPFVFSFFTILTFYLFRWPTFSLSEQNVDESHQIAGALKLLKDPLFWRSIDGITSGPLVMYPLTIFNIFGIAVEYGSARVVGCLMLSGSIVLLYLSIRQLFSESIARISILAPTFVLGVMNFDDLIAYNGEHALTFFLSLACYIFIRALTKIGDLAPLSIFFLGVSLGFPPFAKLQGIPVCAFLGISGILLIVLRGRQKIPRLLLSYVMGLLSIPVFVMALMSATGQFEHFLYSYPLAGLAYGTRSRADFYGKFSSFWKLWTEAPELHLFFFGAWIFCGAGLLLCLVMSRSIPSKVKALVCFGVGYLAATIFCVVQPANPYCHYLLLLVLPSVLLGAIILGTSTYVCKGPTKKFLLCSCYLYCFLFYAGEYLFPLNHPIFSNLVSSKDIDADKVIRRIHLYADQGEPMAMWGWMPSYYIKTGLTPATRDTGTERQIYGPYQEYYLQRYLTDLKASKAPVFVDAVGPNNFSLHSREQHGHETIPDLDHYIKENYTPVYDNYGTRVYVLSDRLKTFPPDSPAIKKIHFYPP